MYCSIYWKLASLELLICAWKLFGLFNVHINHSCYWPPSFDCAWRLPFIYVSRVLLRATEDPMTQDQHNSAHPSYYVSPRPGIEPRLTAHQASMLPTRPPGGFLIANKTFEIIGLFGIQSSKLILFIFLIFTCSSGIWPEPPTNRGYWQEDCGKRENAVQPKEAPIRCSYAERKRNGNRCTN